MYSYILCSQYAFDFVSTIFNEGALFLHKSFFHKAHKDCYLFIYIWRMLSAKQGNYWYLTSFNKWLVIMIL